MHPLARPTRLPAFGAATPDTEARLKPNKIYIKELTILGTAIHPFTILRAASPLQRLPLHDLHHASFPLDKTDGAVAVARGGLRNKLQLVPTRMADHD